MRRKTNLDLHQNKKPVCPWCFHELQDLGYGIPDHDGETVALDCESCGKKYESMTVVDYSFTTSAIGCEKHMLVLVWKNEHDERYECKLCLAEFYNWEFPDGRYPRLKTGEYEIVESK